MKFGCFGCLILLLILAVVLVGGALAIFFGGSAFEIPTTPKGTSGAGDGSRAQEKLFEVLLRDAGRSARRDPIVLSEGELAGFLASYLSQREGMPFSPLMVNLLPNLVEIQGQTALRNLFKSLPVYRLPDYLPAQTMDRPVWVTVRGTVRLEGERSRTGPKYGRLEVTEFSLGNQDMGPWLLWLFLGPERLRWPVPSVVETLTVQEGRIQITTGR